jgi:hypothetical protein
MADKPRRPAMPGRSAFDALAGGEDPAEHAEAAHRTAEALVRGARDAADETLIARIVHLADEHGMDLIARMWASAAAESLPGALWRLYLLRSWVQADPVVAARQFDAGRKHAEVQEVIAGVVEPPGPREVQLLVDQVLRGIAVGDFATSLDRAAAFARVVSVGRGELAGDDPTDSAMHQTLSAVRLLTLADQLEAAARAERAGSLA